MASIINAASSGSGGLVSTADSSGVLQLQTNGTTALSIGTNGVLTLSNALPTGSGGTGLASFTSGGVVYASSTSALTTGSALVFDGTTFTTTGGGGIVATGANGIQANNAGGGAFQSTTGFMFLQSPTASGNGFIFRDTSAGSYAEYMRLNSTGLGIGTSSPGAKLDVQTAGVGIQLKQNATGSATYYVMDNTVETGGKRWRFGYTGAAAVSTFSLLNITDNVTSWIADSSGNLGLGVTPSAWGNQGPAFQIGYGALKQSYFSTTNNQVTLLNNAYEKQDTGYAYLLSTNKASAYKQIEGAHQWLTATGGTAGNAISFTQAMTLDTSGNLLVGTTSVTNSPSQGVQLANGSSIGGVFVGHANGTATGNYYASFAYNSSIIGSITQSGTTAVLYNTSSDVRLKENIVDADSASSLIDALQVRQFDWKEDGSHQRYGFIAQELATVAPEAVHQPTEPEQMMGVDYSKLVPMLVKELQSLRSRVAQLESQLKG